jgi:hypothetical protein
MNQKPDKFIPALYGGIIMAVISSVPFLSLINCLCCAGVLFGGFIAVYFYKNNFTPDTPPFTNADCIAVGALAGVVSAVIGTFLSMIFLAVFGNVMAQFILDALRHSNLQMPDEVLSQIEQSMGGAMTILFVLSAFFKALIVDVVFGLLGGLIGYSVFKPKQQPGTPMPPMPPPPPAVPQA